MIDGSIHEGLVSTGSSQNESDDPLNPDIIERFDNEWRYDPCETSYYATEGEIDGLIPHLERNLQWYETYFRDHE